MGAAALETLRDCPGVTGVGGGVLSCPSSPVQACVSPQSFLNVRVEFLLDEPGQDGRLEPPSASWGAQPVWEAAETHSCHQASGLSGGWGASGNAWPSQRASRCFVFWNGFLPVWPNPTAFPLKPHLLQALNTKHFLEALGQVLCPMAKFPFLPSTALTALTLLSA